MDFDSNGNALTLKRSDIVKPSKPWLRFFFQKDVIQHNNRKTPMTIKKLKKLNLYRQENFLKTGKCVRFVYYYNNFTSFDSL